MDNKGLLFIPDISGFTRFVHETEIGHSRLIIQELLETLIDTNQMGLEISEIEGDAILFYKFGAAPELEEVYGQVKRMFCEFHEHITSYNHRRFCQCRACVSAGDLTLKVITHYGEFTGYNVRNFRKLIGKDIIVAHQLLKNDIDQHEYWLVTEELAKDLPPAGLADWMQWSSSIKQTENGAVPFHYTQLSRLKEEIRPDLSPALELSKKVKVMTVTREYATNIITLFHATGDFSYRSRWQEGVKTVEELNHYLPRVGMRSRFEMEDGEVVVYSSSYTYSKDKIEFSETDEKKSRSSYFTLEKLDNNRTRLTIDFYRKKDLVGPALFRLLKKKEAEAAMQRSLLKLEELLKQMKSFNMEELE